MSTPAAAVEGSEPGAPAGEAPVEGAEVVVEGETPLEEVVEQTPEQIAEAEAAAALAAAEAEKAKPVEIPEDVLKAAAEKFANKTMAAARRAQTATEQVKTENATLKGTVKVYEDFIAEMKTNPLAGIRRLGFASVKEFLQASIDAGGEPKDPTPADEIAALKAERAAEKAAVLKAEQTAKVEASKTAVFAAIDAAKDKYARTATRRGKADLWDAITAYHGMHGVCPDAAVFALADQTERELRAEFGDPVSGTPAVTKTGASAAAGAATAASTGGKTLKNTTTAGAASVRKYSDDPDERRKQVNEDMRAAGEL